MIKRTRMLTTSALLAALVVILGQFSLRVGNNFKFTFGGIPIYIGALLLGPVCGAAVGGVGTFISQLLAYGLSPTTPMWMLPGISTGLISGLYARKKNFKLSRGQAIFILLFCNLVSTTLNTLFIYIDAHIYGYYTPALILGMLMPRYVISVIKGVAYALILPPLVVRLRKALKMDTSWASAKKIKTNDLT